MTPCSSSPTSTLPTCGRPPFALDDLPLVRLRARARIRVASCSPRSSRRSTTPALRRAAGVEAGTSPTSSPTGCARERVEARSPCDAGRRRSAPERSRRSDARRRLADVVQQAVKDHAEPGISEAELAGLARRRWPARPGSRVPGILTVTTGAERPRPAAVSPRIACRRPGDLVLCDTSPWIDGAWSDTANAVCVGPPDARDAAALRRRSRARCTPASRSAAPASSRATSTVRVRELLAEHGPTYGHHTGHRIGAAWSEDPRITPYCEERLEAGMVLALEPAIYLPGWGGIRLEHMFLVGADGNEILTELRAHAVRGRSDRRSRRSRSASPTAPRGELARGARRRQRRPREARRPTTGSWAGARRAAAPTRRPSTRRSRRWRRSSSAATPGTARRCAATPSTRRSGSSAPAPATSRGPGSTWRCGTSAAGPAASRSGGSSAACCSPGGDVLLLPRARRHATSLAAQVADGLAARLRRLLPQGRARRRGGPRAWSRPAREALGRGPRLRLDANGSWSLAAGAAQPAGDRRARHRLRRAAGARASDRSTMRELRRRTDDRRSARTRASGRRPTPTRASARARPTSTASRRTGSGRSPPSTGLPGSPSCEGPRRSASTRTASSASPPRPATTSC